MKLVQVNDGNRVSGDGCSSSCEVEYDFVCKHSSLSKNIIKFFDPYIFQTDVLL